MYTIILLTISNIFMTFAWYGHLKFSVFSIFYLGKKLRLNNVAGFYSHHSCHASNL